MKGAKRLWKGFFGGLTKGNSAESRTVAWPWRENERERCCGVKNKHTWSETGMCGSCTDCGFCGAVYVVLCRFRVGRLVLGGVLGTLHHGDSHFNHLRKSSVAAVPETIVLDCSLIFNICNSSETLSKLLLFLAFFNEKDKNGSDWAFLWSLWQHSRCFAAELLTG